MSDTTAIQHVPAQIQLSDQDISLLTRLLPGLEKAKPDERNFFLAYCHRVGLDPFLRLIHPIIVQGRLQVQVGIDGWLALAERTGQFGGIDGPYYCGEDGNWTDFWLGKQPPVGCRVGVYRRGFRQPVWAVVRYSEFCVSSNPNWRDRPCRMLEVRATCQAIRKAFPDLNQTMSMRDASGRAIELVYGDDLDNEPAPEMAEAVEEAEYTAAPAPSAPPPPTPAAPPPPPPVADPTSLPVYRECVTAAKQLWPDNPATNLLQWLKGANQDAIDSGFPLVCNEADNGTPKLNLCTEEQLVDIHARLTTRLEAEQAKRGVA